MNIVLIKLDTNQANFGNFVNKTDHYYPPYTEPYLEANAFFTLYDNVELPVIKSDSVLLLFAGSTTIQMMKYDGEKYSFKKYNYTDLTSNDEEIKKFTRGLDSVFFASNFGFLFLYDTTADRDNQDLTLKELVISQEESGETNDPEIKVGTFEKKYMEYNTAYTYCPEKPECQPPFDHKRPNCCDITIKDETKEEFTKFCLKIFKEPSNYFSKKESTEESPEESPVLPTFYVFKKLKVDRVLIEINATLGLLYYVNNKGTVPLLPPSLRGGFNKSLRRKKRKTINRNKKRKSNNKKNKRKKTYKKNKKKYIKKNKLSKKK